MNTCALENKNRLSIKRLITVASHKNLHSTEVEVLPHPLQQVIKVPFVVSRDGHAVGDFVDDVQFFNAYLVCKSKENCVQNFHKIIPAQAYRRVERINAWTFLGEYAIA